MHVERLISLLCLVALAGCRIDFDDGELDDDPVHDRHLTGDGIEGSRAVPLPDFTRIENYGSVHVHVEVDAERGTRSHLGCDDNLLYYVDTDVDDDTLTIRIVDDKDLYPTRVCRLYVETPSLRSIENVGAGSIEAFGDLTELERISAGESGAVYASDIEVEQLEIEASDHGFVTVRGGATELRIHAADQADVRARDFAADRATIDSTSDGELSVRVLERLEGDVRGGSRLDVYGDPAERALNLGDEAEMNFH